MGHFDLMDYALKRYYNPGAVITDEEASRHPSLRRTTGLYKWKKKIVRNVWLISGLFMLANPSLPVIVATAIFTAFISFSILDESI
ncbi:hypothetical protein [Hahella sp. HN01]|uniref:hypothetical protein n=1 Tax=unclassified Hahella TaxID=2624107 RepID=UPI001C1F03A7|nr:hypothetical protein [Hahella sp. HN01]MBU6954498.1 hypothetical protein [Hahella sp. HN01]